MEEQKYEMVMPFVTVTSKGGPHEDEPYTAGWEMGGLYGRLEFSAVRYPFTQTIRTDSVPQADLIAMKFGYHMTASMSEEVPEWSLVLFEPAKEGLHVL